MEIRLSSTDGIPVYRQIMNQVKYMIASGRLRPGQELPPIRALAERLVINPNTVVRAYTELQHEGVVESRHGSGTYVLETVSRSPGKAAAQALAPKVDSLLADAAHLNLKLEEVVELVRERHGLLNQQSNV
ncbi:MAG TPA: GntR family transcriptional regulator [Candidatus Sulfotelmatobacter sp.]|nr:GntR family transcriptional regulator [Candidatus Sulfotelmatobacter sp.]HWI59306.1 GntR family transcriptional regulator [Bacillota bacterium]